jgi:hypothetical protein
MAHMTTARKLLLGLLGGSSAAAFSPMNIAGLVLWLDAADASTLFQADNGTTPAVADADPVGYWGDKSGNGKHAIQAVAGSRPALKLAQQNGKNVVRFDGNSDSLSIAGVTLSSFAIFAVMKNSTNSVLMEHSANASANNGHYFYSNNSGSLTVRRGGSSHNTTAGVNWGNTGSTILMTGEFQGTLVNTILRVNGSSVGTGSGGDLTASTVTDTLYLGARAGSSLYLTGDYMEIVIYSPHPGAAAITTMEAYLNAKWSVF